jgi:hypothetical protein
LVEEFKNDSTYWDNLDLKKDFAIP